MSVVGQSRAPASNSQPFQLPSHDRQSDASSGLQPTQTKHIRKLAPLTLIALPEDSSPAKDKDSKSTDSKKDSQDDSDAKRSSVYKPELIQKGVIAFQKYCIECHDAQRSLSVDQNLEDWRETIQRMAKMDDADIPKASHESIAVYLASTGTGGQAKKSKPNIADDKSKETDKAKTEKPKFDPALVERGKSAFNQYCILCHDADRSLQARKTIEEWRANVLRMANKDGANIPRSSHESIATYLASLSGGAGAASGDGAASKESKSASSVTFSGTISPWFRGQGTSNLEYPGFFGDVWVGATVQGSGPLSARATACNSCHNQGNQVGRLDIVEAVIRYDLTKVFQDSCGECPVQASIQAGRFIVPFGAYYQQSNPGVDRAVTRPLIYNMGQRVYQNQLGTQVLPMPYSDEGASLNFSVPFGDTASSTFDAYVVNGLEGGSNGVDFYVSRDYVDNNRSPSIGGRYTLGNKYVRLGSSMIGGRFNSDMGVGRFNQGMNYFIYGFDASMRFADIWRFQWEFAQRNSDRFGTTPIGTGLFQEHFSGSYIQSELLLSREKRINLFLRYDTQLTRSDLAPLGSPLPTGDFRVERITYGINWTLPGGSLLMTNLENWRLPEPFQNINVIGIRWATTF